MVHSTLVTSFICLVQIQIVSLQSRCLNAAELFWVEVGVSVHGVVSDLTADLQTLWTDRALIHSPHALFGDQWRASLSSCSLQRPPKVFFHLSRPLNQLVLYMDCVLGVSPPPAEASKWTASLHSCRVSGAAGLFFAWPELAASVKSL